LFAKHDLGVSRGIAREALASNPERAAHLELDHGGARLAPEAPKELENGAYAARNERLNRGCDFVPGRIPRLKLGVKAGYVLIWHQQGQGDVQGSRAASRRRHDVGSLREGLAERWRARTTIEPEG
jgi:hypothetical protein